MITWLVDKTLLSRTHAQNSIMAINKLGIQTGGIVDEDEWEGFAHGQLPTQG